MSFPTGAGRITRRVLKQRRRAGEGQSQTDTCVSGYPTEKATAPAHRPKVTYAASRISAYPGIQAWRSFQIRGYAVRRVVMVWATNGSTLKTAIPFSPSLPRTPAGGGGGNQTGKRGVAATASANRPVFPPTESWGKTEPEQTAAGAKRPTIRRRISGRHDGRMPACRSPVADLHQRAGGRRSRSRRDGSEADPESTRPAKPGCQRGHAGVGPKVGPGCP